MGEIAFKREIVTLCVGEREGVCVEDTAQGILKGEVSLYPIDLLLLVWISLFCKKKNCQ